MTTRVGRPVSAMREPGLWMATAGAGLVVFLVGGVLEQHAIATYDNFGGPRPWVAVGVAVALWCVAAFQWFRQPRRQPPANAGPGLPTWQGYCIALLSVAWLSLAAVTWFLTEIKSPTFTVALVGAAVGHLVAGMAVVRQNRAHRPTVVER